ncbi:MAG: desulfoferrodoxin family protein [Butyrivibrio sp.]
MLKFYICDHCGNIIEYVKNAGVPVMCCGQKMTELVPGSSDGAVEKHVPVIKLDGNHVTVEVSTVEHPMVEAHYIEWIVLETEKGVQRVNLSYTDKPCAEFVLANGDSVVAAYAYCNLHGLWKSEQ